MANIRLLIRKWLLFPLIGCLTIALQLSGTTAVYAAPFIMHKPEFKGRIIDYDTKEPLEGVVVAVYEKSFVGLGAGDVTKTLDIREAVTDKNGIFFIPSFTWPLLPFNHAETVWFTIYKPGYANAGPGQCRGLLTSAWEKCFSETCEGGEISWSWVPHLKGKLESGLVMLPKLDTKHERKRALVAPEGDKIFYNRQKELIKLLRGEWKYLTGRAPKGIY